MVTTMTGLDMSNIFRTEAMEMQLALHFEAEQQECCFTLGSFRDIMPRMFDTLLFNSNLLTPIVDNWNLK
jgi:hypothetical protein